MKFVSKSSNYLAVLIPGLSAQPLTGTPAKPTVSVRFKDGLAEVPDGELCDLMMAHPGFNSDFICPDQNGGVDPYAARRQSSEPAHVVTEMQFGTPVSRSVKGGTTTLTPELQKLVTAMAAEMAKAMLPSMIESTLKTLVSSHGTSVKGSKGKGKRGRPTKNNVVMAPTALIAPEESELNVPAPIGNPAAEESVS